MRTDLQPPSRTRRGFARTWLVWVALTGISVGMARCPANGQTLSDESLKRIDFDQKLQQQVSTGLQFRDETGKVVKLGDYLGKRPAILVLGYYGCPMLCTLVLNGLVESLQDVRLNPGKDFEIINVSIDPRETPALAAAKKRAYLKRYRRAGAEQGWHFLTGEEAAIRQLADEAGFRYAYDTTAKQYAHPSGLVILTPEGKVSRYFSGVSYSNKEMNSALVAATANKIGSPIQQFFLLCFHYNPVTGKYGPLIMTMVRVGGVLTVVLLGATIVRLSRREPARQDPPVRVRNKAT
jgi:protein SCO1/2